MMMKYFVRYIICIIVLMLMICGRAESLEDEVLPAAYQDEDMFNTVAALDNGDISKRPFGRLFGPIWSMSKRPFGRLFGPYPNKRPRISGTILSKSKRPFGRMFGPTYSIGKRSLMSKIEKEMSQERFKRPFGRLFGPTLLGKRSFGTILSGGYKLRKQRFVDDDEPNVYDILETPSNDPSKRYSWSLSGYKFGKQ